MVDRSSQMKRLMDHYVGFIATHLIRLGVDTGLFATLAGRGEGATADELGRELGYDVRYVEHFLRGGCAAGLLEHDLPTARYRLGPHMGVLLAAPDSYRYMGNLAHLYIQGARDFSRVDGYLRSGTVCTFQEHDDELIAAASDATEGLAQFVVRAVVPRLPGVRGRDDIAALDVGCGSGAIVVALARAFPQGRVVGIDVEPRSVERAAARIRDAGVERLAEVRLAAAELLNEEGCFDLATMIQVLHETSQDVRELVLDRVYAALRPGGILVIVDEPYPNNLAELGAAPVAVLTQFVEIFMGNVLLSPEEQRRAVEMAGFKVLSQMVPSPGLICVTVCQKVQV